MNLPTPNPDDQWLWGLITSLKHLGLAAREADACEAVEHTTLRLLTSDEAPRVVVEGGPDGSGPDRFREAMASAADNASTIEGFTSQLTESFDTIDLLYTIGAATRDLTNPSGFINLVVSRLFKTLNFGYFALVFDAEGTAAPFLSAITATEGSPPAQVPELVRAVRECPAPSSVEGWAVKTTVEGLAAAGDGQILVQTVRCRGRRAGLLVAGGKFGADPSISSYDIQLVRAAAGHLDSFCDNVSLFEEQRALFMATVRALTAAIDAKDRYTFGHSERVSLVSAQIAGAMGMPPDEIETIRLSGLVHDVGKIGVPEAVLRKPGKLTDEEFDEIKKHPQIGWNILSGIAQLANVLPGVLHHHERMDGGGYPHGLRGEGIPLPARIIGVADAFDAMSSSRAYRDGMPREKVFRILKESAGGQLDAQVVDAFFRINLTEYDLAIQAEPEPKRNAG